MNKRCSCGAFYEKIPDEAKFAPEALPPGFYFNCKCGSTMVFGTDVEFRPRERKDGKFAIEVFKQGSSCGFIHWIESSDGRMCRSSDAEFIMSPCETLEQAVGNCNWLNCAYAEGRVK